MRRSYANVGRFTALSEAVSTISARSTGCYLASLIRADGLLAFQRSNRNRKTLNPVDLDRPERALNLAFLLSLENLLEKWTHLACLFDSS